MSSAQSHASIITDPSTIEEIKTTFYVASARLKIVSQETRLHLADNDDAAQSLNEG